MSVNLSHPWVSFSHNNYPKPYHSSKNGDGMTLDVVYGRREIKLYNTKTISFLRSVFIGEKTVMKLNIEIKEHS